MTAINEVIDDIGVVDFGHNIGKTGQNVRVLLSEFDGIPDTSVLNTPNYNIEFDRHGYSSLKISAHASKVVDNFFATAPDCQVFWVPSDGWRLKPNVSDRAGLPRPLSAWDPDLISVSAGSADTTHYNDWTRVWDREAYENDYILFNSMRNSPSLNENGSDPYREDTNTTAPGLGYNIITVGAYDQYDDDLICEHSNYPNHPISQGRSSTGLVKPDVVAPGCEHNGIYHDESNRWGGFFGRSSGATPIAAGIMANRLDEIPGMKGHPAMAKAFMLATSTKNIDGVSNPVNSRISFDGVGAVGMTTNYWNSRWWEGSHNSFFNSNNEIVFSDYFQANRTYRLVISWLVDPDYAYSHNRPHMDIDLKVYDGTNYKTGSYSVRNNFEMVEVTMSTSGYKTIKIHKYSSANLGNLKLGYVRYVK
ncbi:MAG: S8 family serine peptidase [Epsilonproteobacteria bacterium]|nr:S8 family serine peptidase [Campylobacterota bacterium]